MSTVMPSSNSAVLALIVPLTSSLSPTCTHHHMLSPRLIPELRDGSFLGEASPTAGPPPGGSQPTHLEHGVHFRVARHVQLLSILSSLPAPS